MTTHPARPCSSPVRPNTGDDHAVGCSSLVPLPTGTSTTQESKHTPHQTHPRSSPGRAQPTPTENPVNTTWHYPNPLHPSTQTSPNHSHIRTTPCPHCGAPSSASCNTKTGNVYDGVHRARVRAHGGRR